VGEVSPHDSVVRGSAGVSPAVFGVSPKTRKLPILYLILGLIRRGLPGETPARATGTACYQRIGNTFSSPTPVPLSASP